MRLSEGVITSVEAKLPPNSGSSLTGQGGLFAGLTDEELVAVEAIGKALIFTEEEAIFQEGDPGDCMYIVLSGSVTITKTAGSGHNQLLCKVGAGECFGEMSVIDAQSRSARAIAQEPTVLRVFSREDLHQLLIINPQIIINLLKSFSERVRMTNTQFIEEIIREEKLALVGQMARSIIHDIKNPLQVIRGQAELLELDGCSKRDGCPTGRCQSIIRSADHITDMANELLDFSRGSVSLKLRHIAPNAWLDDVLGLLKPMIENRKITLNGEALTTDLLQIDADRMTRAVYNLAANALQAMQGVGKLTVRISRDQQGFEIAVIDNGPGIPEEIRDRLFDPFVTSGKGGGTGLGTSIAKKIIEDHGGQISFETQTGIGTTFHIRFPGLPSEAVRE